MSTDLQKLARQITGHKSQSPLRPAGPIRRTRGVVTAVNSDGTLTLNIDGDTTTAVAAECMAANVLVGVGAVVEVEIVGTRVIVKGTTRATSTAWQTLTLTGNWAAFGSPWRSPQYRLLNNQVVFRGRIADANANGTNEGICFLPATPTGNSELVAWASIAGTEQAVKITVDSGAGTLYIDNAPANPAHVVTFLSLDGLSYYTD